MSNPVALPDDLALFLGLAPGTIDTARAEFLLAQAQAKCERKVKLRPLPAEAMDIVCEVAGRAYTNVSSAHQVSLGSASASFGAQGSNIAIGGLYLSKSNIAELRLIAGSGAAFSADTMPSGVNAVQSVTVSASNGTFTLTFAGATTTAIAYNATAAQVQAALEALSSVGAGNVSVTGAYSVAFTNLLGLSPMPLLTANGSGLAGGTVSVQTTTAGVCAPGANLPRWDRDYYGSNPSYLGYQGFGF